MSNGPRELDNYFLKGILVDATVLRSTIGSETHLDDVLKTGSYIVGNAQGLPKGWYGYGILEVMAYGGRCLQRFTPDITPANPLRLPIYRMKIGENGVWSPWIKYLVEVIVA